MKWEHRRAENRSSNKTLHTKFHGGNVHSHHEAETAQKSHQWTVRAMGCHSAVKRNEALKPAPVWANLDNLRLSERGQTQRHRYCKTSLSKLPGRGKFTETESRI